MKPITLLLTLGLLCNLYGQPYPALEKVLKKELPPNSIEDGRWVYYPDKADIKKIESPSVKCIFPNYEFFRVTLTNYLGYHINQGTCVILFDSAEANIVLVKPLWYSGVSAPLVKLFLKKRFDNREQLLAFLDGIHQLMEAGSGYRFIHTGTTDQLITYDLVYFKGDAYTTGGGPATSVVQYNEDGIWRKIEIKLDGLRPMEYTSLNPKVKDDPMYKKGYRETIK